MQGPEPIQTGNLAGQVAAGFSDAAFVEALPDLLSRCAAADPVSSGRNRIVRMDAADGRVLAVKSFGAHRVDRDRGSKAARAFQVACRLCQCGVGTPEPAAYLDRVEGGRYAESHLVTVYEDNLVSMRDELLHLYHQDPLCARFMELFETVAPSIRAMHEAGVVHNDLGNQNILLRRTDTGWSDVCFIDLNRARIRETTSLRERARDLSRIALPSNLRRVFFEMYFAPEIVPDAFKTLERRFRAKYAWHAWTRRYRHPVRQARQRKLDEGKLVYPEGRSLWIWDDRSEQPIAALNRRDRRPHRSFANHAEILRCHLRTRGAVSRRTRELTGEAFARPVELGARAGMTLSAEPERIDREMEHLAELGKIPLLMRFYHHDDEDRWDAQLDRLREIHREDYPVAVALVQDRRAVENPERWAGFVERITVGVETFADFVEAGHAINRVKWGLWTLAEYRQLLEPVAAMKQRFPGLRIAGPSVIDFEPYYLNAALQNLPGGFRFDAVSHELYVDRRGAPENRQDGRDTPDKLAHLRAIAEIAGGRSEPVILSETNWPLQGTGVYSPVTAPYDSPGERSNDPNVSEDQYADFLLRYLLLTLCSGHAERVYWWKLAAHGFGLIDDLASPWRRRPAFEVFRHFVARLGAATFTGRLANDSIQVFRFETGSGAIRVAWSNGPADFSPGFSYRAAADATGRELAPGEIRQLGDRPVYFFECSD